MADLSELSLPLRLFLKAYPWRRIDPIPWVIPDKPVSQSRLALVTTAGFSAPGQAPFDEGFKGGDYSFRIIPDGIDLGALEEHHRSEAFDHRGLAADPNLVFPRDRVHELEAAGKIGSINHRHLSFMGSITAPGRLRSETAPEAAKLFKEDQVDLALLVPV